MGAKWLARLPCDSQVQGSNLSVDLPISFYAAFADFWVLCLPTAFQKHDRVIEVSNY